MRHACLLSFSAILALSQETRNLAYDQAAPTVPPRLSEHSRKMVQRVYPIAGNVFVAVGFGLANSTMIVGRDGVIIVDTMESLDAAEQVFAAFRKITSQPVRAIVYTHNHTDHTNGVKAFATDEDVASGRVAIFAHASLMDTVISNASVVAPILGLRSAYSFGKPLGKGPTASVNEGIGPTYVSGRSSFIPPTRTFQTSLDVEIAGVKLHLRHAPSETDDEIVVWLPENKVLQTAEVIQGETFPNLHTLRGTKYRDPVYWYKTIDLLRTLGAEHMAPSHGRPVSGKAEIEELLRSYRDAIQFVHDQTIRHMNRGLTPDELVEAVSKLPPHLAAHPWLGEFYGTVKHSVRQIYAGYLGWFEGDPAALDPLPRPERAARYIEQMGGREAVLEAARKAHGSSDDRWSAELLTWLIRLDPHDIPARKLKADCFRQLGYKTENTNWRDFYLMAARELDGTLPNLAAAATASLASADILRALPLAKHLDNLAVRLDPLKSADAHVTIAFRIAGAPDLLAVEVRRGVAQIHERYEERADATLTLPRAAFHRLMLRQIALPDAIRTGEWKVDGSAAKLMDFWSYFDPPWSEAPSLAAR